MHANHVVHFAIHAENVERAKTFYEHAFGWSFEEWGPPEFYLIQTGTDQNRGIRGALQKRNEPLRNGSMTGYECSISVENLTDMVKKIVDHGGSIAMKEVEIPTVGRIAKFVDTEGNLACMIQYNEGVE